MIKNFLRTSGASGPANSEMFRNMVEEMPISVMACDAETLTINYINKSSLEALRTLEHVLPVKADEMLGQCIDIFHKQPEYQRKLLSDPKNLPHKAKITIGGEWLDLLVSAIYDSQGRYMGPMLTWSIITEQVKHEEEMKRLTQMIEIMPINVMMADPETMELTYVNSTSIKTLTPLESLLPVKAADLRGQCIDIFHKNPEHQRRILSDPANLPYNAIISLGEEKLDLQVSAISDDDGTYIGPMLTWSVVTENLRMANNVQDVVSAVSSASTELRASAESMQSSAEQANSRAGAVASASEELNSSISEISRQVTHTTDVARSATEEAGRSSEMINGLAQSAEKIGDVVNIIQDIAEQTNLLALNATIEAARAGEAGKGFAVVASEVKALANQTAKATEEISQQIAEIQGSTSSAVEANDKIASTIQEINEVATAVASAIEEQGAATQEVAENITSVSQSSSEAGGIAAEVLQASDELSKRAEGLEAEVNNFLKSQGVA